MSYVVIRSKLVTALAAYCAAHNPPLPLARENVPFTKPTNSATFLEAIIIPANTVLPNTAADRRRFYGTLQVNVWVAQGQGAGIAEAIADDLYSVFKVFPKELLPVSIEGPPSTRTSIEDAASWKITPIMIPYRLESEN